MNTPKRCQWGSKPCTEEGTVEIGLLVYCPQHAAEVEENRQAILNPFGKYVHLIDTSAEDTDEL